MSERHLRALSLFTCVPMLALAACSAPSDAPIKPGVCWIQGQAPTGGAKNAKPRFIVLSVGDTNLETCAMHVELTSISKHRRSLLGAFQGQYVFVTREAISSSDSLTGQRFSLFTPGQRADVDAQIVDLLKSSAKPAPPQTGAKAPTS